MKIDEFYLKMVEEESKKSDDPTTKVGAVIVTEKMIIGACNQLIGKSKPERLKRPEKYSYFKHAERNAIYHAAKNGIKLEGSTIYTNGTPCARAIVQSGIKYVKCYEGYSGRWKDSQIKGKEILEENNVEIIYHEQLN